MAGRATFSLAHPFAELTLIAATIGAIRLAFIRPTDPNDTVSILMSVAAISAIPPLIGAAIGGLFGSFKKGAIWGALVLGLLLAVLAFLLVVVR